MVKHEANAQQEKGWEIAAQKADSFRLKTYAFYYQQELDSSIFYAETYQTALEALLSNDGPYSAQYQEAVTGLGHLYLERGHYQAAIAQYRLWAELTRGTAREKLALAYYGRTLVEIGAVHQGLEKLRKANQPDAFQPFPMGLALSAEAYLKVGAIEKADSLIERLFSKPPQSTNNLWIAAVAEFTKGCILFEKGDRQAERYFAQAIRKLDQTDPGSQMIPLSYTKWFQSLVRSGQFERADSLREVVLHSELDQTSIHIFNFHLADAQQEMARKHVDRARKILLDIIEKNSVILDQDHEGYFDPWLQIQAYMNLISMNKQVEKSPQPETFQLYKEANEIVGHLRMTYLEYYDQIALSDSLHYFYQDAVDYGFKLYESGSDHGSLEDLILFMEKSKAISLYQQLRLSSSTATEGDIPQNDLKQELNYRYQQLLQEGHPEKKQLEKERIFQLEQRRIAANTDREILLYSKGTTFAQELAVHQSILNFYYGKDRLYCLAIGHDGATMVPLPSVGSVNNTISKFAGLISTPGYTTESLRAYQQLAFELYEQLLAAIPGEYLTPHTTIIPDGQLFRVPFELLITAPTGQSFRDLPYLFKDRVIHYSQSLAILQHLNQLEPNFPTGVLAVAPNQFDRPAYPSPLRSSQDRDFGPLTHNTSEATYVSERLGGILLAGEDATESSFRRQFHPDLILHLATHAFSDVDHPDHSYIQFQNNPSEEAHDGRLYTQEIFQSNLASPLVVLSGCDTGVGKMYRGEGPQSLASSFFSAGARSVMMSLWKANDLTTANLMQQFYHHLSSGLSKDAALREAKINFLRNCRDLHAHPFFWGGFVLVGDASPIRSNTRRYGWLWLFVPVLMGLVWFFRKRANHANP